MAGLVKRPMRDDPELDIIRKRGFEHEERFLADLRGRGPDGRHDRARRLDRGPRRAAARRRRARPIEAMAAGRRRHLPGDVLRRHVARPRRLPAAGRRPGPPVALGPVPLRGRRHQAGPPRQGQRGPPDLLVRRPARARSRASGPEWLHVALGGSARAVERLRVDDYMAYYRSARDRFLAGDGRRDAGGLPAGRHVPGAGRALRRLPLGGRMRDPPARGRPPQPRRRDLGAPAAGPRPSAASPTLEALGELAAADGRRRSRARARARSLRVREQARIQLEGRRERGREYELLLPRPGAADRPGARPRHRCRRRRRATSSSTSRAIRTPSTTASTTSSASSRRTARSTPSGRATTTASSRSTASGGRSSG